VNELDELAARFEAEFNRRDHVALGDLYETHGRWMSAAGGIYAGRATVEAALRRVMTEGLPHLTFDERARVVSGDHAVSRGTYRLDYPEEAGIAPLGGAYLNILRRRGEGWRILHMQTNHEFENTPEIWLGDRSTVESMPETGTLLGMLTFRTRDVGLDGGASAWAPDAQVALPGAGWVTGPPSIRRSVRGGNTDWQPDVVMHDLETLWLDGGLALDVGWYEAGPAGPDAVWGTYTLLARRAPRGDWMVHWLAATASPAPAPSPPAT
jgi:ketosteroid isomerase-like protein